MMVEEEEGEEEEVVMKVEIEAYQVKERAGRARLE